MEPCIRQGQIAALNPVGRGIGELIIEIAPDRGSDGQPVANRVVDHGHNAGIVQALGAGKGKAAGVRIAKLLTLLIQSEGQTVLNRS